MSFKKIIIIFSISFLFVSCQTIKDKSDAVAKKENQEYGRLVGKKVGELKKELGAPTDDFKNEFGNIVLIYKTKKFAIPCDRKFEINSSGTVVKFSSSGCI